MDSNKQNENSIQFIIVLLQHLENMCMFPSFKAPLMSPSEGRIRRFVESAPSATLRRRANSVFYAGMGRGAPSTVLGGSFPSCLL